MLLTAIHFVTHLLVHVVIRQRLGLQLLYLPQDPLSSSKTSESSLCLPHNKELQLLQDIYDTKIRDNKTDKGSSPSLWVIASF
jgi:hypothetical protein